MRLLYAMAILVTLFAERATAQVDSMVGMAQISRSDGLVTWIVLGSFQSRETCFGSVNKYIENFIENAIEAGFSAQRDFAACDTRVPKGTEFEALRLGTNSNRYIFFHPNIRVTLYHPRGGTEYERAACELMRATLASRLNINGRCDPPSR